MKRQIDGTARCQNILEKKQVDEMAKHHLKWKKIEQRIRFRVCYDWAVDQKEGFLTQAADGWK
jgi:hypothetical protein